MLERIQIRELGQAVLRQDQACEVRYRGRERGLDAGDAVAREEEGVQAWGEGEVGEGRDVVVCEVDGILVLFASSVISPAVPPSSLGIRGQKPRRRRMGGGYVLLQRPNSQSLGSCGLQSSRYDINGARFKV